MTPPAGGVDLADLTARLGHLLHTSGVGITPERCGRLASSILLAAPATTDELYWLGRVTLLTDRDQIAAWDRVFAHVFGGVVDGGAVPGWATTRPAPPRRLRSGPVGGPEDGSGAHPSGPAPPLLPGPGEGSDDRSNRDREARLVAVSAEERLRTRDFAALSAEELLQLRAWMRRLAVGLPPRRSRRRSPSRRGAQVDLRATMRRARHTGGDPVRLQRRRARSKPRRLVLLCDISGSMEPYSRAYLELLLSAVGGGRAEAFVFSTRLTRVTRALRTGDADQALERAGRAAPDWAGGTRIGEALKAFNDRFGRPGMARGAVIVILSDGWERGDAALLGREMARLRRLAHRLIWVNPRRADERYRPLAAGMAAALPHVDAFLSGHSLGALDEVLAAITGESGRPGP